MGGEDRPNRPIVEGEALQEGLEGGEAGPRRGVVRGEEALGGRDRGGPVVAIDRGDDRRALGRGSTGSPPSSASASARASRFAGGGSRGAAARMK
ncbi:MAG: hypothetical protein H6710_22420 [Myxococcales bacterium]|nr:hypothetical protein [Myxococcales bacterium]